MPPPLSIASNAVAIDYVVEGPRTAAVVAAARSRLIGLVIQEADQEPRFVDHDLAGLLQSLGDRQRLYPHALFALAVEAMNDLPPPSDFHDFHALTCLLYGHDPFQWQPTAGMDRATLIRMVLDGNASRLPATSSSSATPSRNNSPLFTRKSSCRSSCRRWQ